MLAFCAILCMVFQGSQKGPKKITEDEIIDAILKESDCSDPEMKIERQKALTIDHLEYFDLTGDGQEEAIVVASTCLTGTAGPDIHAVYTRNAAGKVVELPVRLTSEEIHNLPVFGNRNSVLTVANGQLTERFLDTSDRKSPLVITYIWTGKEFALRSMQQEGPFKTSYDCAEAEKEIERAICYSPSVAALDLQLGKVYRAGLQKLSAEPRKALQEDQRKWLVEREKKCVIYKWWVDCLTELYTQRIAELQSKNRS